MQLFQFKNNFVEQLQPTYGLHEAEQFFFMLCEAYLNKTKTQVALDAHVLLNSQELDKFKAALAELRQYKPIQHIIGKAYFYGHQFLVNQYTLIPRPETEELVAWICADAGNAAHRILDIGTGSGCIAISLAQDLQNASVTAVDISAEALQIARTNAKNIGAQVEFLEIDILNAKDLPGSFNVVVSNPPYVRNSEKAKMSANVLDYEPVSALYVSDDDPFIFYRKIAQLFLAKAEPKAQLYFEINEYLAEELRQLLYNLGFTSVEVKKDFREKNRMIKATLD